MKSSNLISNLIAATNPRPSRQHLNSSASWLSPNDWSLKQLSRVWLTLDVVVRVFCFVCFSVSCSFYPLECTDLITFKSAHLDTFERGWRRAGWVCAPRPVPKEYMFPNRGCLMMIMYFTWFSDNPYAVCDLFFADKFGQCDSPTSPTFRTAWRISALHWNSHEFVGIVALSGYHESVRISARHFRFVLPNSANFIFIWTIGIHPAPRGNIESGNWTRMAASNANMTCLNCAWSGSMYFLLSHMCKMWCSFCLWDCTDLVSFESTHLNTFESTRIVFR